MLTAHPTVDGGYRGSMANATIMAASHRTNFSCFTGNSLVWSANTAKLARDLKDDALGLAKANLQNAKLKKIAREERRKLEYLRRQIQAMEAVMASGMMNPLGQ